jgi:acyl-CoA synthetase (AMP-forming)/AMP-acid ligase II
MLLKRAAGGKKQMTMKRLGDVLFNVKEAENADFSKKHGLIQGNRSVLTFGGARFALDEYDAWLRHQLLISSHDQQAGCTNKVIVAFLAHNSADLFLSVIAAASSNILAPAVLLNTRWTPDEIATALCTGLVDGSGDGTTALLLLHDDDNSSKGEEAARLMMRTASARVTAVRVQRLPLIVHRRMTICTTTTEDDAVDQPAACADWSAPGMTRAAAAAAARLRSSSTSDIALSNEDALIVFTSGTTSAAKGVRLSHNAVFLQARVKQKHYYNSATRLLATTLPFYHIGGISSIVATWLAGGCIVLDDHTTVAAPVVKFDPTRTMTLLRRHAVNALVVVPAMLHALQHEVVESTTTASATRRPFHEVKLVLIGGQSASDAQLAFARSAFPNAFLIQTFACTEAASSLTFLDVTIGRPSGGPTGYDCVGEPAVEVAIVVATNDDDNYNNSNNNKNMITSECWQVGRISTRGPHVMNGYWGHMKPHETYDWFVSNDLGCWDDKGRLWFCGRTTDTIRTGGETVFGSEVERTLMLHTAILECAVFGMADDRFGECVCAAVVFETAAEPIGLDRIKAFCIRNGLAGYKQPKRLFALDKLPRNTSGKVLKRLLVEQCSAIARRSIVMMTTSKL